MTKEALKLFIQSLPKGSYYEIISFGSKFQGMNKKKTGTINSDINIKSAKAEVS